MATANSTRSTRGTRAPTTEATRIAGAKCCIEVLRQAMRSTEDARKSVAEEFELKDAVYAEMMAAAGPLSPQAAGVLGALVDFALDSLQNGYGLREQLESEFAPEASRTGEDVRLARATFAGRLSGLEDELSGGRAV